MPINKNTIDDKKIISYISVSIKNEYIRLSKKYEKIHNTELPLYNEKIYDNTAYDIETSIVIKDSLDKLPSLQRYIIVQIFFTIILKMS